MTAAHSVSYLIKLRRHQIIANCKNGAAGPTGGMSPLVKKVNANTIKDDNGTLDHFIYGIYLLRMLVQGQTVLLRSFREGNMRLCRISLLYAI